MNAVSLSKTSESFVLPQAATAPPRTSSAAQLVKEIKEELGATWIPNLYRENILTKRTRSHHLVIPAKKLSVNVQHTLLGVELKLGQHRMSCPDLATARYLAVFARAGCADVAVPYDISQISRLADELESSWQRMLLMVEHLGSERSAALRSRVRTLLASEVRSEITEAGAGTAIPQFNQNTKQRRG